MHQIRPLAHVSALVVAAVATLPAADERLSFTRPTLGAVLAEAPSDKREVLLDDQSYLFVVHADRLFVYGKRQRRWLWIQQLRTEHGRFGVAPPMVSVGWIDGYLINRDFAAVPLGP